MTFPDANALSGAISKNIQQSITANSYIYWCTGADLGSGAGAGAGVGAVQCSDSVIFEKQGMGAARYVYL